MRKCGKAQAALGAAQATKKAKPQVLITVKLGEKVFDPTFGSEVEVAAPCANKNNGRWYCTTHDELFDNQLQKDIHIHTGSHKMGWLCREHGPEVP